MSLGGKGNNFAYVVVGVVATVYVHIVVGAVPPAYLAAVAIGSDLGKPGVFFDFDAPSLVVGEVPVEGVHLEVGHLFEQLLDDGFSLEVASLVEHEVAPRILGLVDDLQAGYVQPVLHGKLPQGLHAVEDTGVVCPFDENRVGRDGEPIAFVAQQGVQTLGPSQYDVIVARALMQGYVYIFFEILLQQFHVGGAATCHDAGTRGECKSSLT